jgi:tetratricopeptide (TPR) repeat protein
VSDHPTEAELLEHVAGRSEFSDPDRTRRHLEAGCADCERQVSWLRTLGDVLADETAYETFFDGLAPTGASATELALALSRFRTQDDIARASRLSALSGKARSLADDLLRWIEQGIDSFRGGLAKLDRGPAASLALLYTCQEAARLVPRLPQRLLEVAALVVEAARSWPSETEGSEPSIVTRERLEAEAHLLAAQALTIIGENREARERVHSARSLLDRPEDDAGFSLALCDYFEGTAASFQGDFGTAEGLLWAARFGFEEYGQTAWVGRAEAAIATCRSQQGDRQGALPLFERALEKLDPEESPQPYVAVLVNRAACLAHLERAGEARRSYAKALGLSLKLGLAHTTHAIRIGLAEIETRAGHYGRALESWVRLAEAAREQGFTEDALIADLYVAECLGWLGREADMRAAVLRIREGTPGPSAALEDLFSCLDRGDLDAGAVAHVRDYLAGPFEAEIIPYRPYRAKR